MATDIESAQLEVIMQLIMNGGNAKGAAVMAIQAAKAGDFAKAQADLKDADHYLSAAHNAQTDMLTKEAQGQHVAVNLLMVHGQDHIMNAITFRDLAAEFVDLYQHLHDTTGE
ncbi:MAG: PTS lactose/cellobiose transporter subunit IIA [Lactobacillus sp.]|jgi:PTS system cellobiose-specific IIA component|nr:PTS lactose/cellobiose transporter subunit IIA [Lactobacillus sp.]